MWEAIAHTGNRRTPCPAKLATGVRSSHAIQLCVRSAGKNSNFLGELNLVTWTLALMGADIQIQMLESAFAMDALCAGT